MIRYLAILIYTCFVFKSTFGQSANSSQTKFSFAFLTDIHLNNDPVTKCVNGLKMAMNKANELKVDFFILGGDNADVDGLKGRFNTADSLFNRFHSIIKSSNTPVYPCIGNHDRFWADPTHAKYNNSGLFSKYFGNPYYSFDHKGVHFIVLNSVETDSLGRYCVGPQQKQWLADDIKNLLPATPIVVTLHVPMLSMYSPAVDGQYTSSDVISNFKEIWDMFQGYNLQMVLQGHQHLDEKIFSKGTWFITGGAVSGSWWGGKYYGSEEGFVLVSIDQNNQFSFQYIDYGWQVPDK